MSTLQPIGIQLVLQGQSQVTAGLDRVHQGLDRLEQGAGRSAAATRSLVNTVAEMGHTGAALYGLQTVGQAMVQMAASVFEATSSAQRLRTALQFSTGNAGQELAYLRSMTNELGLEFRSTAQAYAGFAAAAKGTALEGRGARSVFESISKAAAVMGLSTDQASGALLAVQQMMSKGVVSAEEFRGQLGERMPVALQAAAQATGLTTAEFSKMLESGQVVAEDFLPKFARALDEMLGNSAEQAADRLDAAVNRMSNAWDRFKNNVGQAGVAQGMSATAAAAARDMDAISTSLERARNSGKGFWGQINDAAAVTIARAGFGFVQGAANLTNASINALTGGVLGLNENLNLIPTAAQPAAQQVVELDGKLKLARTEFDELRKRFAQDPSNIYTQSALGQLAQVINATQRARNEMALLAGQGDDTTGSVPNPDRLLTQAQAKIDAATLAKSQQQGKAYAALMAQMATPQEKLTAAIMKAKDELGVLFSPEVERRIRAHFIKTTDGASASAKALEQAERELLEQRKRDWEVGELRNKQIDDRLKFESELAKQQLAAVASEYQATDATNAQALARELANDKTVDATLAMQQLALAQLEQQRLDLEATDNVIPGYIAALEQRIAAQKRLIAATQTGITQDAAEQSAKDSVKAWDKASDKIGDTLTDALMRGFESGKDFAMVLRDTVVNMFKTMVLRPIIQAVVNPVAGALMGGLGMAGTANAAGSALGGAALFGGASLAAIGSSIGTGIMATLTGQSVGAAAGAYSAAGMGGVGAGLSIGAAIPYVAAVLAAPAVVDALFGRKLKETGIQGAFGTTGFEGQSYRYEKGGLFRSDRTTYSAVDAAMDSGLDTAFLTLRNNTAQMARDLGLTSNAVDAFTTSVKLNFKGLTDKQIQEKLAKEFGKMGDAMAELVLGAGATADQLQQLYTQVMGERYQLETKLLQLQGDTVELRRRERDALHESNRALYDQITALEAMQAAVSSAVSTALDAVSQQIGESERAASAARDAARAYGEAGTGLRETIDRLLGRADTAQGAQAAYAQALSAARGGDVSAMEALPALAEAFAAQQRSTATSAVQASVASAQIAAELAGVAAVADVMEQGADYQARLYDVNTAVLEVLRSELQTGNATVERLDSIKDVLTSLGGTIADSGKLTVGAVQTADGNTVAALLDNSGAVVGQLSADTAATLQGLLGQTLSLNNATTGQTTAFGGFNQSTIAQLQSVEGVQGDVLDSTDVVAEATGGNALLSEAILKQLQTPDAGSKFLGDTISFGNEYLAGRLDGVIAAINQQSAAQQAELKRQQDLDKAQAELESIASARNLAIGQVEQGIESIWSLAQKYGVYLNATSGATLLKNTAVFDVNDAGLFTSQYGQISGNTTAAASFKSAFYSTGGAYDQTFGRASELQQLAKDLEAQREAIRALGGVPAFATGGIHTGGLRLVGENGPELEVTGPSRIFNAQQTAAMLGGGNNQAVAAEIRALREEVAMLRAEARATAANTGKTTRLLQRVTRDGEAMQTQVAA